MKRCPISPKTGCLCLSICLPACLFVFLYDLLPSCMSSQGSQTTLVARWHIKEKFIQGNHVSHYSGYKLHGRTAYTHCRSRVVYLKKENIVVGEDSLV